MCHLCGIRCLPVCDASLPSVSRPTMRREKKRGAWLRAGLGRQGASGCGAGRGGARRGQRLPTSVRSVLHGTTSDCVSGAVDLSRTSVAITMPESWVPAVGLTLVPSLGGFMGAYFVRGEGLRWYASLQKPSWHPPRWTLAPIWGTLYSAMGYGSYIVWKELGGFTEDAMVPLGLYTGQLALNWAWPPIFFGARQMGWALADLLLVSGVATATTLAWHRVSPPAARLLYPYLAWLAFATVLNYYVWRDNSGRRGGSRLPE